MSIRQKILAAVVLLAGGSLVLPGLAQAAVLVDLDDIQPEKLFVSGFILDREQTVEIEAVGYRYRSRRGGADNSPAWILAAETRELVWSTRRADSKRASRHLREYKDEVKLPAGSYEVYFSSYPHPWDGWHVDSFGDLISRVFRNDLDGWDEDDFNRACRDFFVMVRGDGRTLDGDEIMDSHARARSEALLSDVQLKDEHYESYGITLDREMDLEIYAVGEADRDGAYDCSWIIDTETKKRVWKFDYRHSDPAGGSRKNRMAKEVVTLPAGSYALFCVTDDSHHFGRWNAAPPHDPFHWGVTVRAADAGMARHASIGEYENIKPEDAILELVKLKDSDYESEGFSLKSPMKLRVYAIGEGEDGSMCDFAWIVDAETRKTVWEMKYRRTEHAGGAKKNRMVDEIVELDAGNYIAFAATDGSHSYRSWNASAPYDKKRWGLTLSTVDGSRQDVAEYEERGDKTILAQIVAVGNNDHKRRNFTMDSDGAVRIYALGEGEDRRMYDFAWIEDESNRVVWEMTTRNTDHAGGARKNRVFNDKVSLDRGGYTLYYESDGSHSFDGWNDDPPRDRWSWGVTVRTAN